MRREILKVQDGKNCNVYGCCPGHDEWPNETYRNIRSKRARSKGIAKEHRAVRRISRYRLRLSVSKEEYKNS